MDARGLGDEERGGDEGERAMPAIGRDEHRRGEEEQRRGRREIRLAPRDPHQHRVDRQRSRDDEGEVPRRLRGARGAREDEARERDRRRERLLKKSDTLLGPPNPGCEAEELAIARAVFTGVPARREVDPERPLPVLMEERERREPAADDERGEHRGDRQRGRAGATDTSREREGDGGDEQPRQRSARRDRCGRRGRLGVGVEERARRLSLDTLHHGIEGAPSPLGLELPIGELADRCDCVAADVGEGVRRGRELDAEILGGDDRDRGRARLELHRDAARGGAARDLGPPFVAATFGARAHGERADRDESGERDERRSESAFAR